MSSVLYIALLLHCAQVPVTAAKDVTLPDGYVIKGVQIRLAEDDASKTLDVDYRTTLTARCEIQSEARKMFKEYVKARAKSLGATSVDLWPRQPSGITENFYWVQMSTREWKEEFGFLACKESR